MAIELPSNSSAKPTLLFTTFVTLTKQIGRLIVHNRLELPRDLPVEHLAANRLHKRCFSAPSTMVSQQEQTRPRTKSMLSFGSSRTHKSSGSIGKMDLTESPKEKNARKLTSKTDPSRALNEAQPCKARRHSFTVAPHKFLLTVTICSRPSTRTAYTRLSSNHSTSR